jgi:hypothetical protein
VSSSDDTLRQRPWLLDQSVAQRPTAGPAFQAPPSQQATRAPHAPQAPRPASTPAARPASIPIPRPASTPNSAPTARAFGPRSPFADDEERYIPPGMVAQGEPPPHAPLLPPGLGTNGFAASPVPNAPNAPGRTYGGVTSSASDQTASYGYSAPAGGATGDARYYDPYQRGASGPAPTLLHVCQTCGQLTAPDAVYCQNCHHPIAYECPNCHLSLLPIQDRCPRCQAPNPASVRRAHRNPGG